MWTVVFVLVVIACVLGGVFYGVSYLSAKASKKSVDQAILDNATALAKKVLPSSAPVVPAAPIPPTPPTPGPKA